MDYQAFLNRVIDDGIEAMRVDYAKREPYFREGGVAGFEACRGKNSDELAELLTRADHVHQRTLRQQTNLARYWRLVAFRAEVEWVCNVVSAALETAGELMIVQPTVRGTLKAAEILGVR